MPPFRYWMLTVILFGPRFSVTLATRDGLVASLNMSVPLKPQAPALYRPLVPRLLPQLEPTVIPTAPTGTGGTVPAPTGTGETDIPTYFPTELYVFEVLEELFNPDYDCNNWGQGCYESLLRECLDSKGREYDGI
eukprot:scaffold82339_cov63-Cyclotella_meneghiniana.AAC.2